MLAVKNNLSPHRHNGRAYRIKGRDIGAGIIAPCAVWDDAPVTITADQALVMPWSPAGSQTTLTRWGRPCRSSRSVPCEGKVEAAA
jgi:hypothetical protein